MREERDVAKSDQRKGKHFGQVFTPATLVQDILDTAGYRICDAILKKHVIDNSCGDGAFLDEVVRRYSAAFLQRSDDRKELVRQLETFVHGIELDREAHEACLVRLNGLAAELGLPPVKWDVRNASALDVNDYDGKMDFVVGNPPYVRVHNLDDSFDRVKQFRFANGGMTDLYLVFYEIGLQMMTETGRLCYIAPSSWINSVAGRRMREELRERRCLRAIIDLGHYQAFAATTYTAIVLLSKVPGDASFAYGTYAGARAIRHVCNLKYSEAFVGDMLFLGNRTTLRMVRKILSSRPSRWVQVKNGFATLADDTFIADEFPFTRYVIPTIKASTGKWRKAFFPYDKNGKPLAKEIVFADKAISEYLETRRESLLKGRSEAACPDWYLYGRTQALKDVASAKYAINTCIRDAASIKFERVPAGAGVYSGLYVLTDVAESTLREVLFCDDFISYVASLKKYKSGGYYTFSSGDLEQYMNVMLDEKLASAKKRQRQMDLNLEQEDSK